MIYLFFSLIPALVLAGVMPPTPFPVFLKSGFSSVLEFEEPPERVVLGDTQSFQVEKVDKSIVVRTLSPYAASNLFVYFRNSEPKLFVLTASEDANPTNYKKFEESHPQKEIQKYVTAKTEWSQAKKSRILKSTFDKKKDYLTLDIELCADSKEVIKPMWSLVRLSFENTAITPLKLWASREYVQRDSAIRARLVFAKPNIPRDLKEVSLVVPLQGKSSPLTLLFTGQTK